MIRGGFACSSGSRREESGEPFVSGLSRPSRRCTPPFRFTLTPCKSVELPPFDSHCSAVALCGWHRANCVRLLSVLALTQASRFGAAMQCEEFGEGGGALTEESESRRCKPDWSVAVLIVRNPGGLRFCWQPQFALPTYQNPAIRSPHREESGRFSRQRPPSCSHAGALRSVLWALFIEAWRAGDYSAAPLYCCAAKNSIRAVFFSPEGN